MTELAAARSGQKLHTARSRNDQVAPRPAALGARGRRPGHRRRSCRSPACSPSGPTARADAYLPGYTHLQRAQPVLLAHHLRAHAWALLRDADRLMDAAARTDVSPLGAGALAGSSLPLDPAVAAASSASPRCSRTASTRSRTATSSPSSSSASALLGVHLSRMGEELVLWTTAEFGFATLDDRYATGSSMLPQKKNPDVAELARGKAGRLIGNLTGAARDAEGPAALVQPRPPGGQRAPLRLGPPGARRARRAGGLLRDA